MAKIKLTPGQLYFLREKDFLTKETTQYVKIGLVRDSKETEQRIKEHQTGNPRNIYDYCSLISPFVEHLETHLHYKFGSKWITGEWFDMSITEMDEAIHVAKQLIAEQNEIKDDLEKSYELANVASNGEIICASQLAEELWGDLISLKVEMDRNATLIDIIRSQIGLILGTSGSIDGVAKHIIRRGTDSFDKNTFAAENPGIYEQYATIKISPVSGSFTLKGKKSLKDTEPELYLKKKGLPKLEIKVDLIDEDALVPRTGELEELHKEYIELQKNKHNYSWDYLRLEARLKILVGNSEGIDGLCGWKREPKSKIEFDAALFRQNYPELYKQYLKTGLDSSALSIFNWRAYPTNTEVK